MTRPPGTPPAAAAVNGFLPLTHSDTEVVLCADVDRYGTRLVTVSADHRLRVFELDEASGEWELVDAWRGHNGMILDVRADVAPPPHGDCAGSRRLARWLLSVSRGAPARKR